MWRILQNFPRAFRQTWNSYVRPGAKSVHQEDENIQSSLYGDFLPNQAAAGVPKPLPFLKENRSLVSPDVTFDRDWHEWRRTHYNDWYHLAQPTKAFEALGWGTFVVLGLQLSRFFTILHEKEKKRNHDLDKSLSCPLLHVACSILHQRATSRQILPETNQIKERGNNLDDDKLQNHAKPVKVEDLAPDEIFDEHVHIVPDDTLLQETKKQCNQTTVTEDVVAGDVESVWREYEALADVYNSISDNISGLQHAQAGQFDQAVTFWRAASAAGYSKAQYNLALCYQTGTGVKADLNKAVELYEKATDSGHSQALYNLAVMHLHGSGGLATDEHKAISLLQKAASQGLTQAHVCLGILLTKEEHEDFEKAAQMFDLAAQKGDEQGQFYLGQCYENGLGVPQNECKAVNLYSQAAKRGHVQAKHKLAEAFENGLGGLPEDKETALLLYSQGADAGDEESQQDAARLQDEMSRLKAQHAVLENQAKTRCHRKSRVLHTSVSMPAFTEYVRKHLHKIGFSVEDFPQSSIINTNNDVNVSVSKFSIPTFYISEDEDDAYLTIKDSCQSKPASFGLWRPVTSGGLARSASFSNAMALVTQS